MNYADCCSECVQNGECLMQDHGDVEDCQDYQDMIFEENEKDDEDGY
jgi:hypothetical protein